MPVSVAPVGCPLGGQAKPGPQSEALVHATSHCGMQALPFPPSGAPNRLCVDVLAGTPGPRDHPSMKQLRPGPQSESLWQGRDMHMPVGPPSAPTPASDSSQYQPFGQSEASAHARASAGRGGAVTAAKAQIAKSRQTACRVVIYSTP